MRLLVDQHPQNLDETKPRLSVGAATALSVVLRHTGPFGLVASVVEKMVLCGMVWWFLNGWCGGGHGAALSVAQGVQHADDAVPVAEIAATAKLVQHEDAPASGAALV